MTGLPITEPPEQACRVLLQLMAEERDVRKRQLMLQDCRARARDLPPDARQEIDARIFAVLDPADPRARREPLAEPLSHAATAKTIDVLVVTVIPVELRAALVAFGLDARTFVSHERRRYYETPLPSDHAGRDLRVVVSSIGRAGNTHAANGLAQMRRHYEADAYFLAGIAAGRRDAVNLGDVVVPEVIKYFEPGVQFTKSVATRAESRNLPEDMFRNLGAYDPYDAGFSQRFKAAVAKLEPRQWPPGIDENFEPGFPDKVILACGERVRRDNSLQQLARQDDRIKAGAMEDFGFANAVFDKDWAIFRGIRDRKSVL